MVQMHRGKIKDTKTYAKLPFPRGFLREIIDLFSLFGKFLLIFSAKSDEEGKYVILDT